MRSDIQIADENGTLIPFQLAQVQGGQLAYQERTLDLFKPSVQIGEATYASFDPQTQAIFAQDDLSGGVGKRFQAQMNDPAFKQVRYAEGIDFGAYGILPGPALATIAKPVDGGSLTGAFELGGDLYLILGRIIAKYRGYGEMVNTSFETWAAGLPTGWSRAGTGTVEQEGTIIASGASALKMTQSGLGGAIVYQTVAVDPEKAHTLSMQAAGDGSYAGNYRVLDASNGDAEIVPITSTGITAAAYSAVTQAFTTPAGCTEIKVVLHSHTGDYDPDPAPVCYFDDVTLGCNLLADEDLGAGVSGYSGATWLQEGAEASGQASTGTGAASTLDGPEKQAAQLVTPGATGYLGRVDVELVRADTVSVQTITIIGSPTGGTFPLTYASATTSALAYNVSAEDMQAALRLLPHLEAVTVTKAGVVYTVTFTGVTGAAQYLVADGSGLTGGTNPYIAVGIARIGTTVTGNVELAVQTDYNGRPSGMDVAVAAVSSAAVPTAAGTVSFRFDTMGKYLQVKGEPYWLVLRALGASPTATIAWTRGTAGTEDGYTSSDSGNSWTATYRHKYESFVKAITQTAFVGKAEGAKFLTTTDGAAYTADASYEGKHFCVFQDLLVRDCRSTSAGSISWSQDGVNWSEPIAVGDPNVEITGLLALPNVVLVCKTDSVWAVDPNGDPAPLVDSIVTASPNAANGGGACVWRQAAYIPFNGGLLSISGDFSNGFTIPRDFDLGPTALPEWESPWGAGRVVAVAGDRHCLYAALSTESSYKLFKSYAPLERRWIGSIADLGTPTTLTRMVVFDQGGDTNPLLFVSGDSDNVTRLILPLTANPTADTAYQVSTALGSLYRPAATGNMPANPKSWLFETATFLRTAGGGYLEVLYDTLDGEGWRAVDGRLYGTGILPYEGGLSSLLLDSMIQIKAASALDYPILQASGVTYTVRAALPLKEYRFTLEVERGVSGNRLGSMLGVSHAWGKAVIDGLPVSGGTRTLVDPDGDDHRVAFRSVVRTIAERAEEGHSYYEVVGVGVM